MAKENVKLFYEALTKDTVVQKEIKEKEKEYTGNREDRDRIAEEILIPVAAKAGYDFTVEELKEAENGKQQEGSLKDEELEAVSGGGLGVCIVYGTTFRRGGFGECFIIGDVT